MLLLLEGEDESGSSQRLSQGRVPLSSCRMVGEDSQEREYNPVTAGGVEETGTYPQASAQHPRGAGGCVTAMVSTWRRCTKRFLSGSAALSQDFA